MGNISQSARTPYGFILVRNRLKRLKELVYRSGGSLESSLREDFSLSVRFCPNSPFAPSSPHLAREARVVGKRLYVSGGRYGSYTSYYVTFDFANGEREEHHVGPIIYGMLVEGDLGILHSQGTYIREFNRRI